jgi:hypothetical protein
MRRPLIGPREQGAPLLQQRSSYRIRRGLSRANWRAGDEPQVDFEVRV